jgi:hypothetical protein
MMCIFEIDMAQSVEPADVDTFIDNAAWALCSTYHMVLKASQGTAIFGCDMLFDISFVADWTQIGVYMQCQATHMRIASVSTLITKLVTKY